jgi:hypothetical protein
MHSFVGVPYVSVSASVRRRHIQKGVLFAGPSVRDEASITARERRRNVTAT